MSRRIAIDPVTRVEGHGKVTLLVDDNNNVTSARLHIVEFRGFEKFIQGRPYWELPLVVQRLCGICPVSHHLAAAKAIDQIVGSPDIPSAALAQRKLLHFAQILQSHALHFFHLAAPDLLFGFDSDLSRRNIVGLIKDKQTLALQGVKIRKFGQQIIEIISGKRIHGIAAIPGGMQAPLSSEKAAPFRSKIGEISQWCNDAIGVIETCYLANRNFYEPFGSKSAPCMSLSGISDALEFYDGQLKVIDSDGVLLQRTADSRYYELLREQVKSWSYMKFPYLTAKNPNDGWYRVGPLARLNTCTHIDTPMAERQRKHYFSQLGFPVQSPLAYHWARMIEALHCAEAIGRLLDDDVVYGSEIKSAAADDATRENDACNRDGIGVIEAPRGTLIHHYQVNPHDQVVKANLIVSTTHNNQAMNESIRQVANTHLSGKQLTPELLSLIEVAIRAYDPCLSCATHAAGRMPLKIELIDTNGKTISAIQRSVDGECIDAY